MANDLKAHKLYQSEATPQQGKDSQTKFNTGRKQGGLQTTYRVSYAVFLNCIREKNHTCACWMAMPAMLTLTSAEQEFHPLLPHPPKALAGTSAPCPVPAPRRAHRPTSRGQAGEGHLPHCLGSSSSAETAQATSSKHSAGVPLACRGSRR